MREPEFEEAVLKVENGEIHPTEEWTEIAPDVKWRINKYGFTIIELGFKADPRKRTQEWQDAESKRVGQRAWLREYLRNYVIHEGKRVFEDYNELLHRSKLILRPWAGVGIVRGWDVGPLNRWMACVALQVYNRYRVRVLHEWLEADMSLTEFAYSVLRQSKEMWQDNYFHDVVDANSFKTKERLTAGQLASVDILKSAGVRSPKMAQMNMKVRHDTVGDSLTRMDMEVGGGAFQLSHNCELMHHGFIGGYQWRVSSTTGEVMNIILKNEYSHIHDALQFALVFGMRQHTALEQMTLEQFPMDVPLPSRIAPYEEQGPRPLRRFT